MPARAQDGPAQEPPCVPCSLAVRFDYDAAVRSSRREDGETDEAQALASARRARVAACRRCGARSLGRQRQRHLPPARLPAGHPRERSLALGRLGLRHLSGRILRLGGCPRRDRRARTIPDGHAARGHLRGARPLAHTVRRTAPLRAPRNGRRAARRSGRDGARAAGGSARADRGGDRHRAQPRLGPERGPLRASLQLEARPPGDVRRGTVRVRRHQHVRAPAADRGERLRRRRLGA